MYAGVVCGCWTWLFMNTPHPYLVPILSSPVHPYIFCFFKFFLCSTESKGRRKERALLIFFISSDCPYNVKEDVARRQKKKDAQIKKLEEAAKEGMLTYIIFNKGLCRCMYCQYRVYIQYLCCIPTCA